MQQSELNLKREIAGDDPLAEFVVAKIEDINIRRDGPEASNKVELITKEAEDIDEL